MVSSLCGLVEDENKMHRTDVNDDLEDVLCKLVNHAFGLKLENLNEGAQQTAGIDLGDKSSRVCYQITSRSDANKVHECLDKFEKRKWYDHYDKLVILFANAYKPTSDLTIKDGYSFKVKEWVHYENKYDLIRALESIPDLDVLEEIASYLEKELSPLLGDPRKGISVIEEILDLCISRMEESDLPPHSNDLTLTHTREKIQINFTDEDDAEMVNSYLLNAIPNSNLIGEVINEHPTLDQAQLEDYLRDVYNKHKLQDNRPLAILMAMVDMFIPKGKEEDILYITWSRYFVMKFFENCTIFKKTQKEKSFVSD